MLFAAISANALLEERISTASPASGDYAERYHQSLSTEAYPPYRQDIQPRRSRYQKPVKEWRDQQRPSEDASPSASFLETSEDDGVSDADSGSSSSYATSAPAATHHDNVYCRCAPLACNCSKTCSCYANPDGTRAPYAPSAGVTKNYMAEGGRSGHGGGGDGDEIGAASVQRMRAVAAARLRSSGCAASSFARGFFEDQPSRRGDVGASGGAQSFLQVRSVQTDAEGAGRDERRDKSGGSRSGAEGPAAKQQQRRRRLRGGQQPRDEWCVHGSRTHRGLERNIAAAADERRVGATGPGVSASFGGGGDADGDRAISMLQLNATAPARSGASAGGTGTFRNPSDLFSLGGDLDFRRHATHSYLCDATNCNELKCKCKRYCRCRGVPIPLFAGEDDENSRSLPAPVTEAGHWPWSPRLYSTYTHNTDPPRSGGLSG